MPQSQRIAVASHMRVHAHLYIFIYTPKTTLMNLITDQFGLCVWLVPVTKCLGYE